jgi:prolyl-tRNA synthetase
MKQSELFVKTLRDAPKDEESVNAKLLIRAGFINKTMAGSYSFLPLGLRVLRKIETVVREEMNTVGGQEILMSMLHPKALWETTGGWNSIDVLFKVPSRTEKEYALGQSEEEVVTPLVLKYATTYKDLPVAVYQIHWKFRDELRAKSGILRGKEFLMKDMYSFHETQEDFDKFYAKTKKSYLKIYKRLGLVVKVTEASGGTFTKKISYEFMVLTDAGEDDILYCDKCEYCVNSDIANVRLNGTCPKCGFGILHQAKASEVGNVFDLGQKYGKDFGLTFVDNKNERKHPIMGCYGIGITRLMGVIVEKYHDDKGIIWPESVAPFKVHLLRLGDPKSSAGKLADKIYKDLLAEDCEVLYDERIVSAGEKFADADLLGIPYRLVVSEKNMGKIEIKKRNDKKIKLVNHEALRQIL